MAKTTGRQYEIDITAAMRQVIPAPDQRCRLHTKISYHNLEALPA